MLGKLITKNSLRNKELKYSLVQSVSNKYGFINQDEYFENRILASKETSNYYVIKKGYFAYNPSRIDVSSLAYKFDENISIISPLYISFKANNDFLSDIFLLYWFSTEEFVLQMKNSVTGSVRKTLNYNSLIKIGISIPPTKKEQQKIADCLSSLDRLIDLHEQKHNALKDHKKGLMQRLFPAEGKTTPALRFPEFQNDGAWEVKTISGVFNVNEPKQSPDYFDKQKIITVKLHTLGVVKNKNTYTLTGKTNYVLRHKGQFIFSKIDFLNGAFGIIPKELDGFVSSSDIPAFSFQKSTCANFFYYWLVSSYKNIKIERTGTSNTLKRISVKDFLNISIPVPSLPEQQKIADCLSSSDALIRAEAQKIAALKDHKTGLMQQLFPRGEAHA